MSEQNPYAPPQVADVTPAPQAGGGYAYTVDPRALTKTLLVLLAISLVAELIVMAGDLMQLSLLDSQFTQAEADANDERQGLIGLLYLGIFIVTGFIFLKWIRRANINSRGFGALGMQFTPGWSIGYYFIPFINLVRPFQAMKEILQISRDPRSWSGQAGGMILGWWWGLWLFSAVMTNITTRSLTSASSIEDLESATNLSLVSSMVSIVLIVVAATLVMTIARNQEKLVNEG